MPTCNCTTYPGKNCSRPGPHVKPNMKQRGTLKSIRLKMQVLNENSPVGGMEGSICEGSRKDSSRGWKSSAPGGGGWRDRSVRARAGAGEGDSNRGWHSTQSQNL